MMTEKKGHQRMTKFMDDYTDPTKEQLRFNTPNIYN